MRRTLALIVVVIFAAVGIVRVILLPTITTAGAHGSAIPVQTVLPVYDLDVAHPGMSTLPVEEAPMP